MAGRLSRFAQSEAPSASFVRQESNPHLGTTRAMNLTGEMKAWLPWVIKIRFVIIIFVFAIEYAIQQIAPTPGSSHTIVYLGVVVIFWLILNLFFLIYNQISHEFYLQAYLQIFADIVIITAIVHVTGDLASNYFSLYLVAIILSSMVLPRSRAFMVAGVSFVLMGSMLELAYLPNLYPDLVPAGSWLRFLATTSSASVDSETLKVKIAATLFGFFAVAYLSSYLAESLRKTGAELRDKSGQVASLQAFNENIILSMRDGLATTNLEGIITELNPAGALILGLERETILGQPIQTVFPAANLLDPRGEAFSADHRRQEITYRNPDNENLIVGVSASPLIIPDAGTVGYVYTLQDLTVEKRLEAEYRMKDRMATLGRMAAGIAHEIRNPLASVAGAARVLQSIAEGEQDQMKLIGIVSQESERLNKLVSDFLTYSREQRFEFREMDLAPLLEETLVLLKHHPLFSGELQIEKKLPPGPVMIVGDQDKMRQVFWNICDNALKAMAKRGVLRVEVHNSRKDMVSVLVSDTGMGMTSAQMEKIFEPFHAGFPNGTGLGLAIVYQIIQRHHGKIQVESTPGKGTQFSIDIPSGGGQESARSQD
jgi:two-component system, NtrC family, sensor histidine kinase PilS